MLQYSAAHHVLSEVENSGCVRDINSLRISANPDSELLLTVTRCMPLIPLLTPAVATWAL